MNHVEALITQTGEVLSFPSKNMGEVIDSYALVNETIAAYERIKKQLQKLAAAAIDGTTYEHGKYMLRVSTVQRMNYDKSVMRELLDPDTFDTMLEPAKSRIDTYLKENLDDLGDISTRLRESMTPVGNPYQVVKLERLER